MIGIDIVKIKRISEACKNQRFLKKILNEKEIEYVLTKSPLKTEGGFSFQDMTVAGLFASKEAILKALMIGMTSGLGFKEITIGHEVSGAPKVMLSKKLEKVLFSLNKTQVFVSIAHDGEYATAIATLN